MELEEPPTAEPPPKPPLTPEQELQRAIRLRENLKRFLHMISMKSIRDMMGWEQKAVEQQTKTDQQTIGGEAGGDDDSAESEAAGDDELDAELEAMEKDAEAEMEWVAGDKTITETHHHHHAAPPAAIVPDKPAPTPASTPSAPATNNGLLPMALVGVAMLAGGAGLGYIVNDLLKPTPPGAVGTDTDTDTTVDINLPP